MAAAALLLGAFVVGCQHDASKSSTASSTGNMGASSGSSAGSSISNDSAASGQVTSSSGDLAAAQVQPAASSSEATKLLDQTMAYIKENKLDLAEKSLKTAEQMKPQLPTSFAPRIDQARSALELAKQGSSLLK
jgi:hypothetical protein